MTTQYRLLFALIACFMIFTGCSEKTTVVLKNGDEAPLFELKSDDGTPVSLAEYRGKAAVILYFYPKDGTPGCTKEACGFRDSYALYQAAGLEVLGVSTDDTESHEAFKKTENLPFLLLSDDKKEVSEAYGVLGPLGMSKRMTFLIDRDGVIQKIYTSVSPAEHAEEVLRDAKDLGLSI